MKNSSIVKKFEQIVGKNNVLSQKEDRYPYAFDLLKQGDEVHIPDYVVLPENKFQVCEIVKFAAQNNIPIVPRGAGTNQVGACVPSFNGIVIHF